MVYDADGELVRCLCSSVAPMQGFFVRVEETTTICIKTTSPYVDLGLPSGTLWAACNVGAVAPEDYGDYFAWGETQPKDFYDWSTYQYCNGSYNTLTKYCSDASFGYNGFSDTLSILLREDDAATANWGNDWRMPTEEEWQELYNNTTHVWTTQNGVNGRLFTSENGNSLFLPAGGIYSNGSLGSTGSGCYYWSSSLSTESPNLSWQCSFYSNGYNSYEFARFFGLSVRPVRSGIQSTSYIIDATANPTEGGEVSGSGSFIEGTECTLIATANEGYTFTNWTENDELVSTDANYTFTVTADRNLVANFTSSGSSDHDYVDLGLPSGTLWATCNVGANSPEEYGDYFAWGETQPKDTYNWNSYLYCNGCENSLTKYCNNPDYGYNGYTDTLTILLPEDDAATANWGTDWRMPTREEWAELYYNTTCTWTTQNGMSGRLFTASNGNSIFLPAAGYRSDGELYCVGSSGYYWTSSRILGGSEAWLFYFDSGFCSVWTYAGRNVGRSVRAVRTAFIINAMAYPMEGGVINGEGAYQDGEECTLIATANEGFIFTNWTENGVVVSTDADYSFTVTNNRTLVANFTIQNYTITVSANPSDGGSVSGGGNYNYGQICTVAAITNSGYYFTNWTENGNVVSNSANYSFVVRGNRTLVAQMQEATIPTVTTVQLVNIQQTSAKGKGCVVDDGNADVIERGICWSTNHNPTTSGSHASNGMGNGSFAVNMNGLTANTTYHVRAYAINCMGTAYGNELSFTTLNNGSNNHEYVDLDLPSGLLWATCNVGADNPEDYGDYFAWGETWPKNVYSIHNYQYINNSYNYPLTKYCNDSMQGYNGFYDDLTTLLPMDDAATVRWGGGWRMPTKAEWQELLYNTTVTWTTQNGVNGRLVTSNNGNSLFLPAAGYRLESSLYDAGSNGNYWSSLLTINPYWAWILNFNSDSYSMIDKSRYEGLSVRAVCSEQPGYSITASASPANGGTVSGNVTYPQGQICTLSATAATGFVFTNWTENGSVVSTNANYTFTVNSNRTLVAHFSAQAPSIYTISVSSDPSNGGTVTGGGTYQIGLTCTVVATANTGYTFVNWTENGSVVSTNANYTFTVNSNRTLVANFSAQVPNTYTISVLSNPTNGGSLTGGGTYQQGQSCTVSASANTGYTFTNWMENNETVSTDATYTFTVNADRTLVANFNYNGSGNIPTGAINGLFSVSASRQVYFSQGNLQYIGSYSTPYWKFADNQWDILGTTTGQNSSNQNIDRDLFGWGTSGYNHGADCYQPWSTSISYSKYYAYGDYQYNLYDQTGQADWGYNAICNGINQENQWRTLTQTEWNYVFNTRTTASGIRYAKANVNNINGIILLPDDWNTDIYSLNNTNISSANFSSNTIFASQWTILESAGAVFLPAAGYRIGSSSVSNAGTFGSYWSASNHESSACDVTFNGSNLNPTNYYGRYYGQSVRLVSTLENIITKTVTVTSNPIEGGSVSGGGTYQQGQSCTVSATAASGYTFTNWTENGSVVSTNANYTFTVNSNRTLVAHFSAQTPNTYTINVSGNPSNGGSVTGGGTYQQGQYCTVSAIANTGYTFLRWTENGNQVSTNASYTFTVTSDRTLDAQFQTQSYTIIVSANPTNGGSVTGGGSYNYGQSCTVTATAVSGYTFLRWTENGNQVSTNANYTFTVTGNRTLVAQFQSNATIPTVTTTQVTNIALTTAVGGGNVTSSGGATVTERGICWSTGHNPTTSSSHTSSGTGTGSFTVSLTGLTSNTTYFVRAYAINSIGTAYGNEVSFTTLNNSGNLEYVDLGLPSGLLWATCNVGADSPEDYGGYFAWGETTTKSTYTWSTYQYCNGSSTTLTKYCNISSYGYNGFTDNLTILLPEDDAAAANWAGNWRMPTQAEFQELLDNTTFTWTTQNGVNGRLFTASNGNTLFLPATGEYTSTGFSDGGSYGGYWSSSLNTDIPNCARCLGFNSGNGGMGNTSRNIGKSVRAVQPGPDIYYITVLPSSVSGGTVTGGGTYQQGQSCTVSATANAGYSFTNWIENGNVVSTNASYTFTVTGNRTLVAKFTLDQHPTGAINGLFTINANGDQVFFSQGNLQYRASTGTWRFAENQWDYVGGMTSSGTHYGNVGSGYSNNDISQTYNGWIDLFGWGTSGWPTGVNRLYQPWQTGSASLFGPPGENDLTGSYANSDWGVYNAISNGGNTTNTWRTLTGGSDGEWKYIFESRSTASGIRYAKAQVNGVRGVILLPDDWNESFYPLYNTNMADASWYGNNISVSQWPTLEQYGAVFLPAAGYRDGTSFYIGYNNIITGYYWSSTCSGTNGAKSFAIDTYSIYYHENSSPYRNRGYSVRLVQDY